MDSVGYRKGGNSTTVGNRFTQSGKSRAFGHPLLALSVLGVLVLSSLAQVPLAAFTATGHDHQNAPSPTFSSQVPWIGHNSPRHDRASTPSPVPPTITNVGSGYWSDPKTWGGVLPSIGQEIVVNPGTKVTYDLASSPNYWAIDVQGSLIFAHRSTSISFQNMTVEMNGYVEVGTLDNPMSSNVNTILYLNAVKEGSAGIMVMPMGHLEIHGAPARKIFSKLVATTVSGSTTITVADNLAWHVGDHVVITSTSLVPGETEENSVAAISGNKITLARPLNYSHDGVAPAQGEIADLTRNVVVTSLNPDVHAMGIMFMYGAMAGLSYAEFSHLGGEGILGHYPIHFHHAQDSMRGTVINGVSVWDSHNRFITIHNTNGITVENSVGYEAIGHGFFLEDATEEGNTLVNNIAILTMPGMIRPDDGGAAGFWAQNPKNNFTGNIAVSAAGSGFDFSIPEKAPEVIPFNNGNFQASLGQSTTPSTLSITQFKSNEAHSNGGDGFHLYRLDVDNSSDMNTFSNLKMWRNDAVGVDLTASPALVASSLIFGNQFGNMQVNTYNMTISKVTFLGELKGIQASMNQSDAYNTRYMTSPFGLMFTASNLTIADSTFSGHAALGNFAFGDLLNAPGADIGWSQMTVFVSNTNLLSKHVIIFGYPFNGDSFIKVVKMNGDPSKNFVLYRYDTNHGSSCSVDTSFMAVVCPLTHG
jgi:hypothetical protein